MHERLSPMPVIQAGLHGLVADTFRRIAAKPGSGLDLVAVAASRERHVGENLGVALPHCPPRLRGVPVVSLEEALSIEAPVVFSGLRNEEAAQYERRLAAGRAGLITNSGFYRMDPTVALFNAYIPSAQPEELYGEERDDYLTAVGNCTSVILSVPSAPIVEHIGVKSMYVETLQDWSGDNKATVPPGKDTVEAIQGDERSKIETEPNKFFGTMTEPAGIVIRAKPNRGPWAMVGHHAELVLDLERPTTKEEVVELWNSFRAPEALRGVRFGDKYRPRSQPVTTMRRRLIHYGLHGPKSIERPDPMQVKAHLMGISEDGERLTFEAVGNNLMLGAAGSAAMNIAYLRRKGFIKF